MSLFASAAIATTPVTKLCFQGGPKDGQFIDWFSAPPVFVISRVRPAVAVLVSEDDSPPGAADAIQLGTYELVPTAEDHLWRIARLYRWKGWDG